MNIKNSDFAEIISENTYPVMLTIATFQFEDPSDDRGRTYFGDKAGTLKDDFYLDFSRI